MRLPCLPTTKRAIELKLQKAQTPRVYEKVRGGLQHCYLTRLLPKDVLQAIKDQEQIDTLLPAVIKPSLATPAINAAQQSKAMAKADLLRLYMGALSQAPWGEKDQARNSFIAAYNTGAPWPVLYAALGPIPSWKTLEGWKNKVQKSHGDTFMLADRRGHVRKGMSVLTEEQTTIVLRFALHPNKFRISEAIRMARVQMHAKGISNGHAEDTYRRWLKDWAAHNYHVWVFMREGAKAWNDKVAYYIERDYSLINVGDVLVADGHVLNWEIINPWTGKPKRMTLIVWKDMKSNFPLGWEIMPTEDTAAISSALRRAIIMLGRYPKVAYLDNGRAFRARFFEGCADFDEAGFSGLYKRLGMQTIHAWPYHGQSKTVERFFGSFSELERLSPTYVGTSIANKPPRLHRGERLHRKAYEKSQGDQVITLEQAHRAIAAWFDLYIRRPQDGHLNGVAPIDLYEAEKGEGVDPTELQFLMMSVEIKTIHRNGITMWGQHFYHPALYGRRHPVVVRYDLMNRTAVYVFEETGEFLGAATPVELVHPAAAQLGNAEDVERLTKHIEHKKHQEKEASGIIRQQLETQVLPEYHQYLQLQGIDSGTGTACRAPTAEKPKVVQIDQAKLAKQIEESTRHNAEMNAAQLDKELEDLSEADRYDRIISFEMQGRLIARRWQQFARYYEESPEYQRDMLYWENRRINLAIMYGVEKERAAD